MDIFNIFSLMGGLAMFLYGMRLMGDSLKENSSGTLKRAMEKVTDNPVKAFILGLFVTAIIQSSTATIVITAGLVGAGILTLHQSLGIIVGANVGTTVTGQIIRLLDIDATGTNWLRFFQPSTLAPVALIIGIVLIMGGGRLKNSKSWGNIAIGFGILFSGLLNMTGAVDVLVESGMVESLFRGLGDNPLIGYFIGATVAFILQSSSASVGILQAFSASGLLQWKAIYAVIVGIYLGDCVTTAIVIYLGSKAEPRRVGIVNILYNLGKSTLVLIGVTIIHRMGLIDTLWDSTVNSGVIADTNTAFNLLSAVMLFPLLKVFERTGYRIVKDDPEPEERYKDQLDELNPVFFDTPALALRSCYDVLLTIFTAARSNIDSAMTLLKSYDKKLHDQSLIEEDEIDHMTDRVSRYIVELLPHLQNEDHISILNQYYKVTSEFERLGDHAVNIADNAATLAKNDTQFSSTAIEELTILEEAIESILDDAELCFRKRDIDAAYRIEPQVQVAGEIISQLKRNHLKRMSNGVCNVYADASFTNLMIELKRIADVCSNIGVAALVRVRPELADHEHLYFESLHQGGNEFFDTEYAKEYEKYFSQLNRVVQPGPVTASAPEEPKTVSGDDGTSGTGKKKTKKKPERAKEK